MWTNWAAIETLNHFSSGGVVAHRIEQWIPIPLVAGSSPAIRLR